VWDPAQEHWGEEDEPIDDLGQANHRARPAASIEMEQVLPDMDFDDPDPDAHPIG
jgi:hypothetical protein